MEHPLLLSGNFSEHLSAVKYLKVLPNPTYGGIMVKSKYKVKVFNIVGDLIETLNPGVRWYRLTSSGVYFFESGDEVVRIVVVK